MYTNARVRARARVCVCVCVCVCMCVCVCVEMTDDTHAKTHDIRCTMQLEISQRGLVYEAMVADASNALDRIRHNNSIQVKCKPDFMVQSNAPAAPAPAGRGERCATSYELRCENGEWLDQGLRCLPAICACGFNLPCGTFSDDPNALPLLLSGAQHGSSVQVTCKPGFKAQQLSVLQLQAGASCQAADKYVATCSDCQYQRSLACAPVSCGPANLDNAVVTVLGPSAGDSFGVQTDTNVINVTLGQEVLVTCNKGFRIRTASVPPFPLPVSHLSSHRARLKCASNCSFAPSVFCVPITCVWNTDMASKYNSVDVTRRNYSHGENVLIQCAQGHYLPRSRKCAQMYFAHCVDGQFEGVEECRLIVDSQACGCGRGACAPYARSVTEASWTPLGTVAHGEVLQVRCALGFRAAPVQDEVSFCNDSAFLSVTCNDCSFERTHACRPVMCSHHVSKHSCVQPFEHVTFGTEVELKCARGFRAPSLHASASSSSFSGTCRDECEMSPKPCEGCVRARCGQVPEIPHSVLIAERMLLAPANELVHGDVVRFTCNSGYQVLSDDAPACATHFHMSCDDGTVTNTTWRCGHMRCGCGSAPCGPVLDGNARSIEPGGQLSHGESSIVTCNAGFRAGLAAPVTCSSPESYQLKCTDCVTSGGEACRRTSCGPWRPFLSQSFSTSDAPLVPSTGSDHVSYGQTLTLSCPYGHRLASRDAASRSEPLTISCESNCSFTTPPPGAVCLRISCGDLSLSSLVSSSRVEHVRVENVALQSTSTVWSRATSNASSTDTVPLLFGDVATVVCAAGFMSSAASPRDNCRDSFNISCNDQGSTDGRETRCIPRLCGCGSTMACSWDSVAQHAQRGVLPSSIPRHDVVAGSQLNMTCLPGFRWAPATPAASGALALPSCDASSQKSIETICTDCQLVMDGQCLRVQCPAFTTHDPMVQSWTVADHDAIGLVDPSLPSPYGSLVQVLCKEGYRAANDASCDAFLCTAETAVTFSTSCNQDCTYSKSPMCLPVTCGFSTRVKNADFATIKAAVPGRPAYEFGDVIQATCKPGFRPWPPLASHVPGCASKTFEMTCADDGSWRNHRDCVPVTCPSPAETYPVQAVQYGQGYQAQTCPSGYNLSTPLPLAVCNESCLLSTAQCQAISCGEHQGLDNSAWLTPLRSAVYQGPPLSVRCDKGHVTPPALSSASPLQLPEILSEATRQDNPGCQKVLTLACSALGTYRPLGPEASCVAATCPPYRFQDPHAVTAQASLYGMSARVRYDSTISVRCPPGFRFRAQDVLRPNPQTSSAAGVQLCRSSGLCSDARDRAFAASALQAWSAAGIQRWMQGAQGEDCRSVCQNVGLSCQDSDGRFPTLDQQFTEEMLDALGQSCAAWDSCLSSGYTQCPMMFESKCWYPRTAATLSSCTSALPTATRICPCGQYSTSTLLPSPCSGRSDSAAYCPADTELNVTCGQADTDGSACLWRPASVCERVTCHNYSAPADAAITDSLWFPARAYLSGEAVQGMCRAGFASVLSGHATQTCSRHFSARCLESGNFSQVRCHPISCSLEGVSDLVVKIDEHLVGSDAARRRLPEGSVATLSCPAGHVASGSRNWEARCESDCRLLPFHACLPTTCPSVASLFPALTSSIPPVRLTHLNASIAGMDVLQARYTYGHVVSIECGDGSELNTVTPLSAAPGLEKPSIPQLAHLGNVLMWAVAAFPPPSPTQDTTLVLPHPFSELSIVIPAGA